MFQNRHGGLPLYVYKVIAELFRPSLGHPLWIATWKSLNIALFWVFLFNLRFSLFARSIACAGLLIDPVFIYGYTFFISEPISIFCALAACVLLTVEKKPRLHALAFFLIGMGFYARLNFLWLAVAAAPVFYKPFLKRPLKNSLCLLLGALPQLAFMNYQGLLSETMAVQKSFEPVKAVESLFNALFHKGAYLSFYGTPETPGIALAQTAFIAVSLLLFIRGCHKKKLNFIYAGAFALLSFIVMFIAVKPANNSPLYLFYLVWPFWFLMASALDTIQKKSFKSVIAVGLLMAHSAASFGALKTFKPHHRFNTKLYQKIALYLEETDIHKIDLFNETSRGILEYLSNEEIKGSFLELPYQGLGIKDLPQALLISGKKEGIALILQGDKWSAWSNAFKDPNEKTLVSEARKYRIDLRVLKSFNGQALLVHYKIW